MKRILIALGAAALGVGLLAGCGDDDAGGAASGDYCSDLEAAQKELNSVQGGDVSSLEDTLDSLETLRDEAPDQIADAWKTLYTAFDRIVGAFQDAGLISADIDDIQNGQIPDGVDQKSLEDAYSEIAALGQDAGLKAAVADIQEHAQDECGVELQ